ncbi:MAG: class I SAM-dependent methyltransferase, partial [Isosphaeraceae bacterium]
WAVDLWFSASENLQRVRDAGADGWVFPLHADARSMPFADGFFDAIVSVDSFMYYGTDAFYLNELARFVKPGGQVGIVSSGLTREIDGEVPEHLRAWWTGELWSLHSADWWRRHWERTGIVAVETADAMPDGWQRWVEWQRAVAPENTVEIDAIEADQGAWMGYIRVVARRRPDAPLSPPIVSVPTTYTHQPILRGPESDR